LREAGSGSFKDGFEVFEDALGLFRDAGCDDLLRFRIERDLAGSEDKISRADGLGVWPDGGGTFPVAMTVLLIGRL